MTNVISDLTAGQTKFLDQYTRKLMVQWCHESLSGLGVPTFRPADSIYRDYAIQKKWVSHKDGSVIAAGWATAAAFLKR